MDANLLPYGQGSFFQTQTPTHADAITPDIPFMDLTIFIGRKTRVTIEIID